MYYSLISRNNNNSKNSVLNTVLNTVRAVKSFSVPPEECNTLSQFIEFANREFKGNFSQAIIFSMKETLERHTPSNPQPTIDRCLNLNMPVKSNALCCVAGCIAKSKFQLILANFEGKKETFNVCNRHKKWRHEIFKFLKGVKPL